MANRYLEELNVKPLPSVGRPSKVPISLILEVRKVKRLMASYSNEKIMRLPAMSDPGHMATMQIMNMTIFNAYFVDPDLAIHIALRMIRITLLHGLCSFSCVSFAYFGVVSCGLRQIEEGDRLADLALELLEKFQTTAWLPRVYACVYGFIKPWTAQLSDTIESLYTAHRTGLEEGDSEVSQIA
jgi:predicted ATPase